MPVMAGVAGEKRSVHFLSIGATAILKPGLCATAPGRRAGCSGLRAQRHALPDSFIVMPHAALALIKIHAAAAKSLQSCPALCDPIDGSPPGSSIPGVLQARRLEWLAISSFNLSQHQGLFQ